MKAPRIPLSGYRLALGRGPVIRHRTSFPKVRRDVGYAALGVFQPAPNYAVDFHFRLRTGFGARFLFGRLGPDGCDGRFRSDALTRVKMRRFFVASDRVVAPIQTKIMVSCRGVEGLRRAVVLPGETPLLFASWGSWYIPSADGRLVDSVNRVIRAGFSPMESKGLFHHRLVAGLEESSGGKIWSAIELVAALLVEAAHSMLVVDAGPAIVESTFPTVVAELKSRRCLNGEGWWMRTLWVLM